MPVDPEPIPVCELSLNQYGLSGIWDGYDHLLSWATSSEEQAVYGNRVDTDGAVYDGDGFVIAPGVGPGTSVASDDFGHAMAANGTNRVRRIEDPGPLADLPEMVREIDASALGSARLIPNPTTGECRLGAAITMGRPVTVPVIDGGGREVASRRIEPGSRSRPPLWDGRLADGRRAPVGIYLVRIDTGGIEIVRKLLVLR